MLEILKKINLLNIYTRWRGEYISICTVNANTLANLMDMTVHIVLRVVENGSWKDNDLPCVNKNLERT